MRCAAERKYCVAAQLRGNVARRDRFCLHICIFLYFQINGIEMKDIRHDEAVRLLQQVPVASPVVIVVYREDVYYAQPSPPPVHSNNNNKRSSSPPPPLSAPPLFDGLILEDVHIYSWQKRIQQNSSRGNSANQRSLKELA